jgi:hypothetical protein
VKEYVHVHECKIIHDLTHSVQSDRCPRCCNQVQSDQYCVLGISMAVIRVLHLRMITPSSFRRSHTSREVLTEMYLVWDQSTSSTVATYATPSPRSSPHPHLTPVTRPPSNRRIEHTINASECHHLLRASLHREHRCSRLWACARHQLSYERDIRFWSVKPGQGLHHLCKLAADFVTIWNWLLKLW